MTITTGDTIPTCTLKTMGEKGPTDISTDDIFAGKKVLLFAVPGAFTPGCSVTHLPGYVVNADNIKQPKKCPLFANTSLKNRAWQICVMSMAWHQAYTIGGKPSFLKGGKQPLRRQRKRPSVA